MNSFPAAETLVDLRIKKLSFICLLKSKNIMDKGVNQVKTAYFVIKS